VHRIVGTPLTTRGMESNDSSCEGICEHTEQHLYAKYGKACLNCVKSKTRCVTSPEGGKCERYGDFNISRGHTVSSPKLNDLPLSIHRILELTKSLDVID